MATLDQLKKHLASLRPLNKAELDRLREEFIIDATYNSNAIEGNTLTLRETALILQEGITIAEKPLRDHLDAIGYRDAFLYIIDLADQSEPLTARIIKEIHSLVLVHDSQNKGRFRSVPVRILGAKHETAHPQDIADKLDKLLLEYQENLKKIPTIDAIAKFHLDFEAIHPFIDGNGRTGRLLLNLELIKHGWLPVNIKFSDKQRYYDSFDHYHVNNEDYSALADLIKSYEKEELETYIRIIENKEKD